MILQQKLEKRKYQLPKQKETPQQSITIPGQALNLKFAMEQFKRGSLIERTKGFYEKEGMVSPDFGSMSRIERLQALADFRKLKFDSSRNPTLLPILC